MAAPASSTSSEPKPSDEDKVEFLSAEWTASRGVVSDMDKTLSGLRQFGFSLITVLLAASSVLYQTSTANGGIFTPTVKLSVMLAILLLISALYATDCFYRIIQSAAAGRAKIIERYFGQDDGLTTAIGFVYGRTRDYLFVELLYIVFVVASVSLGLAVLPWPSAQSEVAIAAAMCVILFVILMQWHSNDVGKKRKSQFNIK